MRNTELARGLRMIAEGFTTLAVAMETTPVVNTEIEPEVTKTVTPEVKEVVEKVAETPVEEKVAPTPEVKAEAPVQEIKEEVKEEVKAEAITEESLNALSYNDLKAKAKELGVKAVGSKKSIIENILALNITTEEVVAPIPTSEKEELVLEEELPNEFRGEEVEIEEEEELEELELADGEESDEEALPEENKTLYDLVARDLEGYTDEELADILSEIGVSPKGRRQALLAKIVQAIEDGKLEWDEESEESEEVPNTEVEQVIEDAPEEALEPVSEATEEDEEVVEEVDFEGTETRKQACYDECDRIEADLKKGNISHKEIIKFLKDYSNGTYISQGEQSDIEEYMIVQCELIDDDGVKHDLSDPYYVGDNIYCCGKHIKELNQDFFCEICGTEYEV